MEPDAQGYVDPLPMPPRARPTTEAERRLVAASLEVYREQRHEAVLPADAWARVTDLSDGVLLRSVMDAEARLGIPGPEGY